MMTSRMVTILPDGPVHPSHAASRAARMSTTKTIVSSAPIEPSGVPPCGP